MRELIQQNITWDSIGNHQTTEYKYEIIEAAIGKDLSLIHILKREKSKKLC